MSEAGAFDALVSEFYRVWFRYHPIAAIYALSLLNSPPNHVPPKIAGALASSRVNLVAVIIVMSKS